MSQSLTEKEIRPIELMAKQRVAAITDVGRMLSRYGEFVHVDCPACGSTQSVPKFEKNCIQYVECGACETFYVDPRPSPDVLEWFYKGSPNYAYWNDVIFPASEAVRRQKIFVPRVDRLLDLCKKYSVDTGAILEVGAGFGTFCAEVLKREVFKRVVAVEPTPDLAETCRSRGVEVFESPVEQVNTDAVFDVVASFEVIEHLFEPKQFIGHMTRLLKPGGLLILTCPNGDGFDIQTLGVKSPTVDHEHLNYFNPESVSMLLERSGMEVLETFTPGLLDSDIVRNMVTNRELELDTQPFLKKVIMDPSGALNASFQEFLIKNGLSSNMWIVARNSEIQHG